MLKKLFLIAFVLLNGLWFYKLLELFQKANVKATYFLLGKTIEDHPQMISEIINEGHEIACHTYSHPFIYKRPL